MFEKNRKSSSTLLAYFFILSLPFLSIARNSLPALLPTNSHQLSISDYRIMRNVQITVGVHSFSVSSIHSEDTLKL